MDSGMRSGGRRGDERESDARGASGSAAAAESWDAARVRALREHLDESQSSLAERIGTRQQTISEWETGGARPRRMSRRLLHMVAEEGGFYSAERAEGVADGETDDHEGAAGAAPDASS